MSHMHEGLRGVNNNSMQGPHIMGHAGTLRESQERKWEGEYILCN